MTKNYPAEPFRQWVEDEKGPPILVSACLLGVRCRYDGQDATCAALLPWVSSGRLVAVCPEVMAGLSTPRPAAWLVGGDGLGVLSGQARVESKTDPMVDLTQPFLLGAEEACVRAEAAGVQVAVLKEGSPSCGVRRVNVAGAKRPGMGVTTARLLQAGILVISEEEWSAEE